jgi:hypothetical protein
MTGYRHVTDDKLIDQLFAEGDRLSRGAVDEIVRRGGMVERLGKLVSDPYNWNEPLPAWWAVVHAVYILGAVASEETVLPLLRSLRYAEACENDWVTEDLPSIFGAVGPRAAAGLRNIAEDETSGWYARAIALEGLAAITLKEPALTESIFLFVRDRFRDAKEERMLRQTAGHVLLDFLRTECRDDLLAFGREERGFSDSDAEYHTGFTDDDVTREFGLNAMSLDRYTRNWLSFYEQEGIEGRQKRWEQEQIEQAERPEHASAYELCPFASDRKRKKCCLGRAGLA